MGTPSTNSPGSRLPSTADHVVIGGGITGISTAFQLAKRGAGRIVVLERRYLGAGASGKSGALVRAHYTNLPEAKLTHESIKIFSNWSDTVGHGDPGFDVTGFIRVVAPSDEAALWANVAAMREDLGIDTWVVTPEELRDIEPLMRTDDITVAAFEPNAGYCDPNAALYGFAGAAQALGVTIATATEAISLEVSGDRITSVETAAGRISTNSVLVAAGALADRLLLPLGLNYGLIPWRSQVVVFRWPADMDQIRRHRVVIDSTQHSWFRCEGTAGTLIGAEYGERRVNPEAYNESVDPGYVDHARAALAARFPVFAESTMRGAWSGVYMQSPDFHPILDKIPSVEGLYLIAGDAGTSFKTAPAIGICMAEWMTDGAPALVDLRPFRSTRFAEGQPWVDEHAYRAEGGERTIAR